jgi:LCP family protein required for cell wall assembly
VNDGPQGPPEYKVYRSRRRPLAGVRTTSDLDGLRKRLGRKREKEPGEPRELSLGRVLKWAGVAIVAWLLLSLVIFLFSAQVTTGVSDNAKQALSGGGSLLTGTNILVLGSDQREGGSIDKSQSGPARADSIMVVHSAFGTVRKLSVPRDSYAQIPGHGAQKINAAYAIGGTPLTIKTVESFLGNGMKINHVILVSFSNFPKLIDALGGVTVTLKKCIRSNSFSGQRVVLSKGEHHLSGREALFFARVRKNSCSPNEDDRARAKRQQQVFGAMRDKVASPVNWPSTFVRGPFIAWQAPQAIRSDMHGPGLAALFVDLLTGGSGKTRVLLPDSARPFINGAINVTPVERTDAVNYLLGK